MFVEFGNSFLNAEQIQKITIRHDIKDARKATITFSDGTERTDYFLPEKAELLTSHIISAPLGYETIEFLTEEDGTETMYTEPVVAFALQAGNDCLLPITAENGLMTSFVLKAPNGRVCDSGQTFFESADEYLKYRAKESARRAAA